jgi:hypothetical protein
MPDFKINGILQVNETTEKSMFFNSRFESGNLKQVFKGPVIKSSDGNLAVHEFNLYLNFDMRNDNLTQWYYFSARNIGKGNINY